MKRFKVTFIDGVVEYICSETKEEAMDLQSRNHYTCEEIKTIEEVDYYNPFQTPYLDDDWRDDQFCDNEDMYSDYETDTSFIDGWFYDSLYDQDHDLFTYDVSKAPTDKILKKESTKVSEQAKCTSRHFSAKVNKTIKKIARGFRRTERTRTIKAAMDEFVESASRAGCGCVSLLS